MFLQILHVPLELLGGCGLPGLVIFQGPNFKLAFKFHDSVFADIKKLKGGEKALKALAKKAGVNMKKLKQTLKNKMDIINARIQEDMNEASKFNFQGTPGFLVNGIPVKGAYPLEHFDGIIEQLQKRKLITL